LHTLDILFLEILGIMTWFNPIIYFYKKSIKNIHEFLADESAAAFQGDKASYAMLLLSQSFGTAPSTLTHSFYKESLVKKRIYMLHKERSKKTAILKYAIFIPLFSLFIIFSSATIKKNKELKNVSSQFPLEKQLDLVQQVVVSLKNQNAEHKAKSFHIPADTAWLHLKQEKNNILNMPTEDGGQIYDFVSIDQAPEFIGGIHKFYEYVAKNLKYPEEAYKNNIEGKVFLSFIVEKTGAITNLNITRGLGYGTDEEALRVMKNCPKWEPGMSNGNLVRVKYNLNMSFRISKATSSSSGDQIKEITDLPKNEKVKIKINTEEIQNTDKFPLIIINGIPQEDQSILKYINPESIVSISVLKEEAAVSKYGIKGLNGVLLISTKNN